MSESCDPMLEWVAISFSRGTSWPKHWTEVSHTAGRCFINWATREVAYIYIKRDKKLTTGQV